jgi:predicted NBD/HSP70 family sugar kinase
MANSSTAEPRNARDVNLVAVLDVLRTHGASTRAFIARATQLSSPTTSDVVADLVAAGVARIGSAGPATGGRRGGLVELIPDSYVVAAIDLSARRPFMGEVDLCGEVVDSSVVEIPGSALASPYALVDWVSGRPRDGRVVGMGVSVPGVTDPDAGRLEWSPRYEWRDVDLRDLVREAWPLDAVLIENDLNLAAVGEHAASATNGDNMVMLGLRGGLGAGVITGGKLYHGSHNSAGEVGYLALDRRTVASTREFGPLEGALFEQLRRAGLVDGQAPNLIDPSTLTKPLSPSLTQSVEDLLFQAALALSTALDPASIVLGEELVALVPNLPTSLRERLSSFLPHPPSVVPSRLGERASLRGAGIATLSELTPSLRRLLS